jgi:hypothetical protein
MDARILLLNLVQATTVPACIIYPEGKSSGGRLLHIVGRDSATQGQGSGPQGGVLYCRRGANDGARTTGEAWARFTGKMVLLR